MKKETRIDLLDGDELIIEREVEKKSAQLIINNEGICLEVICKDCPFRNPQNTCHKFFRRFSSVGLVLVLMSMGYRKEEK